jgi:ParB/RepB/Spo0J family partition protein
MSAQIRMIPVDHIEESPFNPRKHFNDATLAELAESIKHAGLQQPIKVRPIGTHDAGYLLYQAVFGHRRLRAARLAGLDEVPALVEEMSDDQVKVAQIAENLHREDVTPLEEAEALDQLRKEHGYTTAELQRTAGKSRTYVFNRLKLLEASADVRTAIAEGRLQADAALPIARLPSHTLQNTVLAEVLEGVTLWRGNERVTEPMSVRQVEDLVRDKRTPLAGVYFQLWDATLVPDAGSCTGCRKNTTNCPELLEEGIEADLCMDKACLDGKAAAHLQALVAPLEAAGATHWDLVSYQRQWRLDDFEFVKLDQWRAAYEKKHQLDGVKYWIEDGQVHLAIERELLTNRLPAAAKHFKADAKKRDQDQQQKHEGHSHPQQRSWFDMRLGLLNEAQQALLDLQPLTLTAADFNVVAAMATNLDGDSTERQDEVLTALGLDKEECETALGALKVAHAAPDSMVQATVICSLLGLLMHNTPYFGDEQPSLDAEVVAAFDRHGVDLLGIYQKHFPEAASAAAAGEEEQTAVDPRQQSLLEGAEA